MCLVERHQGSNSRRDTWHKAQWSSPVYQEHFHIFHRVVKQTENSLEWGVFEVKTPRSSHVCTM